MEYLLIDVREPEEYARGHAEGAINIPPSELIAGAVKLKDTAKDTPLMLYCISGSRSNAAMHYLRELGFTTLTNGINQAHVRQLLAK